MKIPELLAPVGNMNHLKLAVYNGASSIYLSGKEFGARKFAQNFTLEEIREAVNFAHLYNVKVYVTVNILIKESELETVIDYIIELYKIGVDAILVQDIGLIKIIREILPNFKIHASTQMNIHMLIKIIWNVKYLHMEHYVTHILAVVLYLHILEVEVVIEEDVPSHVDKNIV